MKQDILKQISEMISEYDKQDKECISTYLRGVRDGISGVDEKYILKAVSFLSNVTK